MKKIVIGGLILLVLTLCGQPGPADFAAFKGGEPVEIGDEVVVPFQLKDSAHKINVVADFAGTELEVILDTGGQTLLERNLADSLELETFLIPANKSEFAVLNTIGLGAVQVKGMKVGLITFEETFKFALKGMIGSDFLRFYQVLINYEKENLVFTMGKELTKKDDKDHILPIEIIFPYFPTVDLRLNNNYTFPGMIDTGLHYAFVFPVSWRANLSEEEQTKMLEADGYFARWPWHEDPENYLYKMEKITIGDLELLDVPVIFSDIPEFFNNTTALIGKFFLENYLTTIDFPNRQVNFRELREPLYSLNYSTGVMLTEKDDKLQITGVWQDSPAAEMGLSPDLELLAVEGKKFGEITNKELSDLMLNSEINEISLTILRAGKEEEINLAKRNLLP